MNKRMPPNRGPRQTPGPAQGPVDKTINSNWYRRRWCPPYYDYDWHDYDWHDYDYDYDYYDNYSFAQPKKANAKSANWGEVDYVQEAYRQGFKDGWSAAMETLYASGEVIHEPPMPEPIPAPPTEQPIMPK